MYSLRFIYLNCCWEYRITDYFSKNTHQETSPRILLPINSLVVATDVFTPANPPSIIIHVQSKYLRILMNRDTKIKLLELDEPLDLYSKKNGWVECVSVDDLCFRVNINLKRKPVVLVEISDPQIKIDACSDTLNLILQCIDRISTVPQRFNLTDIFTNVNNPSSSPQNSTNSSSATTRNTSSYSSPQPRAIHISKSQHVKLFQALTDQTYFNPNTASTSFDSPSVISSSSSRSYTANSSKFPTEKSIVGELPFHYPYSVLRVVLRCKIIRVNLYSGRDFSEERSFDTNDLSHSWSEPVENYRDTMKYVTVKSNNMMVQYDSFDDDQQNPSNLQHRLHWRVGLFTVEDHVVKTIKDVIFPSTDENNLVCV